MTPEDVKRVVDDAVAKDRKRRRYKRPPDPFTKTHGITEGEWRVLLANAEYPTQEKAAAGLGISVQTFKNSMTTAKRRMQASSQLDLYFRLGWLTLPEDPFNPDPADMPDTMLVRGHMVVHVTACSCQK
jgi:FixJ family two-component response regulator